MDKVAANYPLNEYAMVILGLRPEFLDLVWDDVTKNEDKRRTASDSQYDFDVEEGDLLSLENSSGDADMYA